MWNQETSEAIQRGDIRLNATENRVLHALTNNALKGNLIIKTQTVLAKETKLKVQNFNRAMIALFKMGFWTRSPEDGEHHVLMFSPYHFWKGDAGFHESALRKFDKWMGLEIERLKALAEAKAA